MAEIKATLVTVTFGDSILQLGGGDLRFRVVRSGPDAPDITIQLADAPADAFADLTGDAAGHSVDIAVCGQVVLRPVVQTRLEGGRLQLGGQAASDSLKVLDLSVDPPRCRP